MNKNMILPPAMLGILGGGQLGSMFTIAAKTMGYGVTVLDPDPNAPAARFADKHLCAPFNDSNALNELAKCAAITTEFENVNAQAMIDLAKKTRVSPSGECVAIAQNRILEKKWIQQAGLNTAPYQVIEKIEDINEDTEKLLPAILKTATLGYDGKGQIRVKNLDDVKQAFNQLNQVPCVLEKMLDLKAEISVIVCRLDENHIQTFDPAENYHENGILAYSLVPARLEKSIQNQARSMAIRLAQELNYVGVLAVEMFVISNPDNLNNLNNLDLVVNEIAPRPHNSGHHTIDACFSSQFQQQVRIMCGLPPAKTDLLSPCCMANILGDIWEKSPQNQDNPNWEKLLGLDLDNAGAYLHLYGKKQARVGRKMGHFTVLAENVETAFDLAKTIHQNL